MTGGSYTALTPPAEGEIIQRQWGLDVRDSCVLRFASASARDSALTGLTASDEGLMAYLQDTNVITVYTGAAWVDQVNTQKFVPVLATSATAGTTNSTSYTSTLTGVATPLAVSFVAACATHCVTVGAFMTMTSTGPWVQYMAPVTTGSGYSTLGPVDSAAATAQMEDSPAYGGFIQRTSLITGLTPGVTYTVTPQFKSQSSAGVASFAERSVIVF